VKRALGRLVTVACVVALTFVLLALVLPSLLGLQRYVITGGSMTGTIPKGAVIYSRITPVEQLKAGDIITFHPPGFAAAVTHRIIAVEVGPDGRPAFRTKGDFNQTADPWGAVTLNEPQQARYLFNVPVLGYVLAALSIRTVRMALIGMPAVLIALSLLWSLWRQAGEEVVRRLEDDGIPHDARSRA
jgi:signal peptidase